MKNVLITTLAAAAVLASGVAFANDHVSENTFYNNPGAQIEQVSIASTFDGFTAVKTSVADTEFGPHNAR